MHRMLYSHHIWILAGHWPGEYSRYVAVARATWLHHFQLIKLKLILIKHNSITKALLYVSGSLSVTGTFFGLLGSLALPLYSIHMKNVLPAVNQEVGVCKSNIWNLEQLSPVMVLFIYFLKSDFRSGFCHTIIMPTPPSYSYLLWH